MAKTSKKLETVADILREMDTVTLTPSLQKVSVWWIRECTRRIAAAHARTTEAAEVLRGKLVDFQTEAQAAVRAFESRHDAPKAGPDPIEEKTIPNLVRKHQCREGHKWVAPIVLSSHAVGLSGEKRQSCPECGRISMFGSRPYDPAGPVEEEV